MFIINPCAAGCGRPSITGSSLCFIHQANPEQEYRRVCAYIEENKLIKDMNVSGIRFENIDFSNRHFYGCNFRDTTYVRCVFSNVKIRMSFFDFSDFSNCDFARSNIQFLSFAGANFRNCNFEESEIVHANFGGATVIDTSFNNSNLYNSRFISADLNKAAFINCNLKRVNFINSKQNDILFKLSNTAESVFNMEEE
jgi:uncharacterized protein YjbI with pentapeptide repeats